MFNHCESAPIPIVGEDIVPFTDFLAGLVKKPLAGEPLPAVPKVSRAHSAFSSISPKWQLAKENAEYADFDGSPPPLVDQVQVGAAQVMDEGGLSGPTCFHMRQNLFAIHPEGAYELLHLPDELCLVPVSSAFESRFQQCIRPSRPSESA